MQDVLDLVNRARAALGLPPTATLPKGHRRDPWECPIARALPGVCVGVKYVQAAPEIAARIAAAWGSEPDQCDAGLRCTHVALPPQLARFVREFDDSAYPDLIAEE